MKLGIILETKEYEKAWNALRFATTARNRGHEVKVFLMGEAVECESLSQRPSRILCKPPSCDRIETAWRFLVWQRAELPRS